MSTPVQLPQRPQSELKKFNVKFVFDHPSDPAGEMQLAAFDIQTAVSVVFVQLHGFAVRVKRFTIEEVTGAIILPAGRN